MKVDDGEIIFLVSFYFFLSFLSLSSRKLDSGLLCASCVRGVSPRWDSLDPSENQRFFFSMCFSLSLADEIRGLTLVICGALQNSLGSL